MEALLLGIDIGTSACKVALFRPNGAVLGQGAAEYPVLYPQAGWAEQDPEDWWRAVCAAVKELLERAGTPAGAIACIGLSGQSWAAIPVDAAGNALCNTPLWMDTRARQICEDLEREIGGQAIFELCGNPLQPTYTLPKILWYRRHRPELYARTHKILQANGYIALRLTGEIAQDLSQGYGLHCFDVRRRRWDDAMCRAMGLRRDLLPALVESHAVVGGVTRQAAAQTGLSPGTPVVAGGLDAACGALGAGVLHGGETQEQGGQAGGMSICMESCRADPRLILGCHVVPDRWLLQGGTVGGGGVVRWFDEQFGEAERLLARENGTHGLAELDRAAARIPAGSEGLVFLPYMAGERSPVWNSHAKGVCFGLDFSKTRAHLARACMEGVAYSLRHNLEVAEAAGAAIGRLRAMGGAANSRLWTQIKSDVTGRPIDVPSSDTATTLGAAILAGVAAGVYRDFDDAVRRTVRVGRAHEPDRAVRPAYNEGFATYLALYRQLEPLMRGGKERLSP